MGLLSEGLGQESQSFRGSVPNWTEELGQKNRQEEVVQTQESGPNAGDDEPSADEGFNEFVDPLLDESFDSVWSGIDGVSAGVRASLPVFLPGLVASELADVLEHGKVC